MTKAIILAAGTGSRLSPYTDDKPKCLVDLLGKSLLSRQIEVLKGAGMSDITLITGYRSKKLKSFNLRQIHNDRYLSSNMVFSLMCASDLFDGCEDIIISYGDIVYEPRVIDAALNSVGDFSVVSDKSWMKLWKARMEDPASDVESFRIDNDGAIIELGQSPTSLDDVQGQYIGLMKLPAERQQDFIQLYDSMNSCPNMYMTDFIQHMIETGWKVMPAWIYGGWLEVDTVQDLKSYESMYKSRKLDSICLIPNIPDIQILHELGGEPEMDIALLDARAREIEIERAETTDAELATFLLAYSKTHNLKYVNTVLKAADTQQKSLLDRWCEEALN